ncbi:hypothetical protein ACKKBG_A07770 [Auxenochlorella protothecoides x Auxenochlorella symbiontica]
MPALHAQGHCISCKQPLSPLRGLRRPRPRPVSPVCGLRCRWLFDVKYGSKQEALAHIQEWILTIGQEAGLRLSDARILSGAVGVPESRIELELDMPDMAALESLWASIPADQHRAWGERLAHTIVHGSPVWHVYRETPVQSQEILEATKGGILLSGLRDGAGGSAPAAPPPAGVEEPEARYMIDWKGDRLKINPGDRLPGVG